MSAPWAKSGASQHRPARTLAQSTDAVHVQRFSPLALIETAQAAINFFVFGTMEISSFSSGALISTQGWTFINYGSLLPAAIMGGALIWLQFMQKKPA